MFEKSLSDLVKGLRSNKRREGEFVAKCIAEIKDELTGKDRSQSVKATAVLKLTYLQMLGYDMSWASFYIVEVMSSPGFAQKRLGYLGASVSYNDDTEVVLLCTNMFKKDFSSTSQYEVGLAINCLANICTTDLARDLVSDVVTLMSSNRSYVRKKAVLVMYKIFLKFPDALRPSFPKLKEKLEDHDTSAVSCAVNVICELARKNPQNYLALAPLFFKLLTVTANNWMLIKIVKLLGALCPLEPRLGKKLVEPLTNIIQTTPAKSLLYECIHTVSVGMTPHLAIVQLSMEKLKGFVEDEDQNLKYLGLLAMGNFMKVHPRVVSEHKMMILKCLDDEDITIKQRALDLVSGMVTKKNLVDIVRILMDHVTAAEGSFRTTLVDKIIEVCSANGYAAISSFEWYITTLCKLARMPGVTNGPQFKQQLMDVIIRVKMVRPFGVKCMVDILSDDEMFAQSSRDASSAEVLYAAAWLAGEFAHFLEEGQHAEVISALLSPRALLLPEHVQAVYVHNALKLLVSASRTENPAHGDAAPTNTRDLLSLTPEVPATPASASAAGEPSPELAQSDIDMLLNPDASLAEKPKDPSGAGVGIEAVLNVPAPEGAAIPKSGVVWEMILVLDDRLDDFVKSKHIEVQERACVCREIVLMMREAMEGNTSASLFASLQLLFKDELNPVAPKAQGKVPVPEGLDLTARIHESEPEEQEEEEEEGGSENELVPKKKKERNTAWDESDFTGGEKFAVKPSKKELKKMKKDADKDRKKRMQDPFYLGGGGGGQQEPAAVLLDEEEVEDIPIFRLSDDEGGGKKKKKSKKHREKVSSDDEPEDDGAAPVVDMGYEMPAGGESDDEVEVAGKDEVASRLNIDISKPLKADEVLPTIKNYERKSRYEVEEEERKRRKKEKKDKEKEKEKKRKDKKDKKAAAEPDMLKLGESGDEGDGEPAADAKADGAKGGAVKPTDSDLDWFLDNNGPKPEDKEEDAPKEKKKEKKEKKDKKKKKETKESSDEEEEVEEKSKKSKSKKSSKKDKEEKEDAAWHKSSKDGKKSKKDDDKDSKKKSSRRDKDSDIPAPKLKPRSLGGDARVRASYAAAAVPDSSAKNPPVLVTVTLVNTGDCTLGPVTINLVPSMNVRLNGSSGEIVRLRKGDTATMKIELQVASINKPQKVKCTIKYEASGEGAPAAPISVPCELLLPCSAFLLAKEISPEEFHGYIANGQCPHTSSTVMEAAGRPFKYSVALLALLLNMRVVEGMDGSAALYAQSLQGHHVAVLAKAKGGSTVSVDVRCGDDALTTQLCNEVSALPLFIEK